MNEADLQTAIQQYNEQLAQVAEALSVSTNTSEQTSLLELQADLRQLVSLTRESLSAVALPARPPVSSSASAVDDGNIDDEYALFMAEMAETGAYDNNDKNEVNEKGSAKSTDESDIEDELTSLPGMKCAVHHTHKWGGQPTLHNAMVASVVTRQEEAQFSDLQVRILFTHPTHAEMLPCPFYLDGDCRFSDEQCRYSHGEIVSLSKLQEAIAPNFESVKIGSRVLVKLKPPEDEEISLTKKSSEKYYLWHRAVVKNINEAKRTCVVKLEQGVKSGEKKKLDFEDLVVPLEEIFPLNDACTVSSDSDSSLSDTEYPEAKHKSPDHGEGSERDLLVERSFQYNGPAMGEWERHTRGIGSKLMFAMGYVAGTGLGAEAAGRLEPVPARVFPVGKSLDHCMSITDKMANQDPLKVEQKLKRMQKKEEEKNKRAYEREKEKERRNVFNFLNKTLGDQSEEAQTSTAEPRPAVKQASSKCLNIEQFKITEEVKRVERDVVKLKNSLFRHAQGSNIHKSINVQLEEKCRELEALRSRESLIEKEQKSRKDKKKLTMF